MNRFTHLVIILLGLAAGCAGPSALQRSQPLAQGQQLQQHDEFAAADATLASAEVFAPASALVFDLPIARDLPPLNLDRESHQPGAFVGFEGPSAEYHTVLINSYQGGGYGYGCDAGDGYQRVDLIQRSSVRYR